MLWAVVDEIKEERTGLFELPCLHQSRSFPIQAGINRPTDTYPPQTVHVPSFSSVTLLSKYLNYMTLLF
jgi:hypothetical protein